MAEEDTAEKEVKEEKEEKPKKKKKVVRRRKSKKERENPATTAVRLAVESGQVDFGARTGLVSSMLGKAKGFVVADNTPKVIRDKVMDYAGKSDIPVVEFEGSSMELGSVCGRPFPVSVLSIYDEGTSNILKLAKK
ncbi:50S ribosomal protein L30e [Candidatus Micrarchaeota archaeon]|nr:50S ribosomal protein L30e [Candidatus Micrarchaeota archaeon]